MILYNTTFHHAPDITADLLNWLRAAFIPCALDFGFSEPQLTRVILPPTDEAAEAYALSFKCSDCDFIHKWESSDGAELLSDMFQRWGEYALAFSTPMEILEL